MAEVTPNYYEILGLARDASADDIRDAYKRAAAYWHPDVNHAPQASRTMAVVNAAYATLLDPFARQQYDQYGTTPSMTTMTVARTEAAAPIAPAKPSRSFTLWRFGRPGPTAGVALTVGGLVAMAFVIWSMTVTGAAERNGLWSRNAQEPPLDLSNVTPEATATPSTDTSWLTGASGEPVNPSEAP